MSILDQLKKAKEDFNNGLIPFEELLLYVEPLLMQVISGDDDEKQVKKIVNDIERVIFTQIEPLKSEMINVLIERGISFIIEKK